MDFYFQSGEFYGTSSGFMKVFIPSLISTLTAIAVIFIKNSVDKREANRKENERLEGLRNYLINTLNYIIEGTKDQNKLFLNDIVKLQIKEFKPLFFSVSSSINIEGLKSMSNIDLLKIFLKKNPYFQKKYNIFQSHILVLESVIKNIQRYSDSHNEEYDKQLDRFLDLYYSFSESMDELYNDFHGGAYGMYKEITDIWEISNSTFQDQQKEDNIHNPFLIKEKIIDPMLIIMNSYITDKRIYNIYKKGYKCVLFLEQYDYIRLLFIDLIEESIRKIDIIQNNFKEVVNSLESESYIIPKKRFFGF